MGYPSDLIWLAVPTYIILQFVVIWRSSGLSRSIAALPLLLMIPVFVVTGINLAQESNLWPIWLLLASPLAFVYVLIVALFQLGHFVVSRPRAVGR